MNALLIGLFLLFYAMALFGFGVWVGRHITEREAIARYRRRLRNSQNKGKHAARQQAVLDGDVPSVRIARFVQATRAKKFRDETEDNLPGL
jgi:hypothetical protein